MSGSELAVIKPEALKPYIWLQCPIQQVEEEVAMFCPMICREIMKNGTGSSKNHAIILPERVNPVSLSLILDYCRFHQVPGRSNKERKSFDEKFVRIDYEKLCKLASAALSLQLGPLVDLTYGALARIGGKSPEEVRDIFHLPDDLTEEEKLEPLENINDDPTIRLLNRLYATKRKEFQERQRLKILQANLPGADFDVQQADLHELNNETVETRTCSMPKEHPTVAKILRTLQELSVSDDPTSSVDDLCMGLKILERGEEPSNLKLQLLRIITDNICVVRKVGGFGEVYKILRTLQELSVSDDPTSSVDDLSMGLKILERGEEPSNLKLPLLRIITDNFCDVLKVGYGGFGEVYKGILRDGTSIAVKKLFNTRTIDDKMFHQEVTSLMMVRHQNIVRFLGYCSQTEERAFKTMEGEIIMAEERERLLCFEYVSNGSLEDYITDELNGLEWNTRYQIIKGICDGLHHLHVEKHIIHMDLKPANILLDERMVPKITDFGLSRLDSKTRTMSVERLFTRGYCAPEYLDDGKMSPKSDIYSLGVIILEIVTGSKEQQSNKKVLKKWRHRWRKTVEQTPLCYKQVSNCLILARSCTHPNPTKRPKISNIIDELINTDKETSVAIDEFQELEDMLAVDPLKTRLRLELNKEISCSFELTNTTDHYFAFRISTNSVRRYGIHPLKDIVAPQSKCSVTITLQALKEAPSQNHCKDDFSLQSTRVDGSLTSKDISEDMFDGETVDNVNLTVVLGK